MRKMTNEEFMVKAINKSLKEISIVTVLTNKNNKGFEINVDVQADGQFLDVTTGKVFKTKKELAQDYLRFFRNGEIIDGIK